MAAGTQLSAGEGGMVSDRATGGRFYWTNWG